MSNPVADLMTDLKTRLQAVTGVVNVVMVYSDGDLLNIIQGVQGLSIGIIYEGLRAKQGDSSRTGLATDATVSLLVVHPLSAMGTPIPRDYSLQVLDNLRNVVRNTTSPSGHYWRFVAEAPAMEKEGNVVWLQRWSTALILTQGMA